MGDAVGSGVIVTKALIDEVGDGFVWVFSPRIFLVSTKLTAKNVTVIIKVSTRKGRGWLAIFLITLVN